MIEHEVLVVGGGPAALAAALAASEAAGTAIVSKVHPLRFLSAEARGDFAAALGRAGPDSWQDHLADTLRAGCALCGEEAAAWLAREAIPAVIALEHQGMPFERGNHGRIAQRSLLGHTAARGCHVGDLTGKALVDTLWGQTVRLGARVYSDYYSLALLLNDEGCCGLMAWDLLHGGLVQFRSKAVVLASGGMGEAWAASSNPYWATGESPWLGAQAGAALRNLEFVVFQPVLAGKVRLEIGDEARSLGAYLRSAQGERLVPDTGGENGDLPEPALVAQAMAKAEKNGVRVQADFRHLNATEIAAQLPHLCQVASWLYGAELARSPLPVRVGAHFLVGGLAVDSSGAVVKTDGEAVPGLFAAGECASTGAHGASLLPGNGLAEAVLSGGGAGGEAAAHAARTQFASPRAGTVEAVEERVRRARQTRAGESTAAIRAALQKAMSAGCGPLRSEKGLQTCLRELAALREALNQAGVAETLDRYNASLVSIFELEQMLEIAEAVGACALARQESRGVHRRNDFPERDDAGFAGPTLVTLTPEGPRIMQPSGEKGERSN